MSKSHEHADDVAPGVARVRPATFRSLTAKTPAASDADDRALIPGSGIEGPASRATTALRAYGPGGAGQAIPGNAGETPQAASATGALEQQLAPLRGLSRELVAKGMPAQLVSELIAEIVAEYGQQVLVSERDARLALAEQMALRLQGQPLVPNDGPLGGVYLVTGPAGAGKSVLIAHLALAAAQRGQRDVVLVNTIGDRIGAAAQMDALGAVFGYRVAHAYSPQELRTLRLHCEPATLILAEIAGWLPGEDETLRQQTWRWTMPGATPVFCVPATAQAGDTHELVTTMRYMAEDAVAALCKIPEARNPLPSLGALAALRQPVGMIVPGPNLMEQAPPPPLEEIIRSALGVSLPKRRKGRS